MKTLIYTVLFTLALSGCDLFKSRTASPPTAAQSAHESVTPGPSAPANTDCQSLASAQPASLAKWTMANGVEFVVCEFGSEATRLSSNSFSGWINIARLEGGKLVPLISEVKSEAPSDAYSYVIQKTGDSNIDIYREIQPLREGIGDDNLRITTRRIRCKDTSACEYGKERCVDHKRNKLSDPDAVATVHKVMSGELKVADVGPYDLVIGRLVHSALNGDAVAKKLLLETPKSDLHLDGAAAESYEDGVHLLRKMSELHCL